jgi:glycogen debranching enzyme
LINYPSLKTDNPLIDEAFRIAIGDFSGNIQPWSGDDRKKPEPCILAGLDYDKPWTRDASLNSWFAGNLLTPEIALNTLDAVLIEDEHGLRIGGQYWDAIIWVTAAWQYYIVNGDKNFLTTLIKVAENSLNYFEKNEFDTEDGLFRGAAFFQDGIAGYPDKFTENAKTSCILDWVENHSEERVNVGFGLPMKSLSTNCLYYNAFQIVNFARKELGLSIDKNIEFKAQNLKSAINICFWKKEENYYRYLVDGYDDIDRQEAAGHAFAVLFGVADDEKIMNVVERQISTKHGVPVVWPNFTRYEKTDGNSYGRHIAIWPHINALWSLALVTAEKSDLAYTELSLLADKAVRDCFFSEIYHPVSGAIYGGVQERPQDGYPEPIEWDSCRRQTWCATGYIQMVLSVLLGLKFEFEGIELNPYLPEDINIIELSNIKYRDAVLNIVVRRSNKNEFFINGEVKKIQFISKNITGNIDILILTTGKK